MLALKRARVVVVHGCFPKGGDSILSAFSWEPVPAKLQDEFLLTKSHDQPGCARAPKCT